MEWHVRYGTFKPDSIEYKAFNCNSLLTDKKLLTEISKIEERKTEHFLERKKQQVLRGRRKRKAETADDKFCKAIVF